MWQYREPPPARGVISPRAMAQTVIRACVWASNFTTLLSRWGFVIDLPGQLELAPVGQWLLAIDVLAGTDRVDGLGRVQAVRGRDADDVDAGVGQERFVLHVHLGPAGFLAGGLESGTVDVADRNGHGLALLLEIVDDVQVRLGSSPGTDEVDADPIVGPPVLRAEDGEARHERRGPCRAQEVTPGRARAVFAGRLPWCLTHHRTPCRGHHQSPGFDSLPSARARQECGRD